MDVTIDRLGVELARTSGDIDGSAHHIEIESAFHAIDVDVRRGGLHPDTRARRNPDLEIRGLRIALIRGLDEHLGTGVPSTGVELVAGPDRSANENRVLGPA